MESILGLDIGSHSVKLIEIGREKNVYTLLSAGSMPTPQKALSAVATVDLESVAAVVRQLVKDTGAKSSDVNIALPESQVFTRVIEVPQLSRRELTSAIQWEAEQYIPLPLDQVNMDFSILREAAETGTGKMEVLLVAAPKALVDRYTTILEIAELNAVGAETEIIASSRAMVRSVPNLKNIMIVSSGAQTTDIALLRKGVIVFTRSISAGGEALTRAVAQTLEFTVLQAEEYKKTYGLERNVLEGKIFLSMKPIMDTIVIELKRAVAYFEERNKGEHIEAVILNGGGAKMPGLVPFITETLGVETQLANPWVGINRDVRFSVLNSEGPTFAVALGLAIRE